MSRLLQALETLDARDELFAAAVVCATEQTAVASATEDSLPAVDNLKHAAPLEVWTAPPPAAAPPDVSPQERTPSAANFSEPDLPRESPLERAALADLGDPVLLAQYNELAGQFIAGGPAGACPVFGVAAPDEQPHVTETLTRVAILLAEQGEGPVLLVDGNPEQKALSAGFRMADRPGLMDVLKGNASAETVVYPTTTRRLEIMPAGRGLIPPGVAGPDVAKSLLAELKIDRRIVLFDLGGADRPLATPLAAAADAVYLLVRLGRTRTRTAAAAAERLRSAGANLAGCIVTNVSR